MSTLFRHGRIFDGTGEELLEDVEVLVEGARIVEVSDVPIRSGTAEVVDLRGRTLMPGLIDAHFHAIAASPDLGAVEQRSDRLSWCRAFGIAIGGAGRPRRARIDERFTGDRPGGVTP